MGNAYFLCGMFAYYYYLRVARPLRSDVEDVTTSIFFTSVLAISDGEVGDGVIRRNS